MLVKSCFLFIYSSSRSSFLSKLRRDIPSKILIHLCFALFLLNMVFLIDSWLALYTNAAGLCISTAFFLHYFLLASFTWMGLEALHLYLSIVKVFKSFISHYMLKFSLAGWGEFLLRTSCWRCIWTAIWFANGVFMHFRYTVNRCHHCDFGGQT